MYSNILFLLKKVKKNVVENKKTMKLTSEDILRTISITEMNSEQLKELNNILQEESKEAQQLADKLSEEEAKRHHVYSSTGISVYDKSGFSKTLYEIYSEEERKVGVAVNNDYSEIEKFFSDNNLKSLNKQLCKHK